MGDEQIPSQQPSSILDTLTSIGNAIGRGAKAMGSFFGMSVESTEPSAAAMKIRESVTTKKDSWWWSAIKCFFGYGSSVASEQLGQDDEELDDAKSRRSMMMRPSLQVRPSVNRGGVGGQIGSDMTRGSRAGRNSTTVTSEGDPEIGRQSVASEELGQDDEGLDAGKSRPPSIMMTRSSLHVRSSADRGGADSLIGRNSTTVTSEGVPEIRKKQQMQGLLEALTSEPVQSSSSKTVPTEDGAVNGGQFFDSMTAARRADERQPALVEEQQAAVPIVAEKSKKQIEADLYIAGEQAKVAQAKKAQQAREQAQQALTHCYMHIMADIRKSALTSEQQTKLLLDLQHNFQNGLQTKSISESKANLKAIIDRLEQLEIASSSSTALSKAADGFARLTGYVTGSPKGSKGILNEQLQSLPYHDRLRAEVDKIEG